MLTHTIVLAVAILAAIGGSNFVIEWKSGRERRHLIALLRAAASTAAENERHRTAERAEILARLDKLQQRLAVLEGAPEPRKMTVEEYRDWRLGRV